MADLIFGIIGTILYPLFSIIFVFLDTLQGIFKSLAGVGDIGFGETMFHVTSITSGNSGTETDTGLIFYLLNTPLVKNMLLSIMILGLFLIIIFTVMAFIKNAYSAKQKGWKEIVGNAIKGLANFIFLPVCCLLGIWLGNILLNAIEGATSSGGSELMSRKLFIAAAYGANHYRTGLWTGKGDLAFVYDLAFYGDKPFDIDDVPELPENATDAVKAEYRAMYADYLDRVYASGAISIYDQFSVGSGYSLHQINYLVIIVGGVFMMYVLVSLAYGMVRRMFILLMLYIISPAMCAMYPLDEGKAVGQWKGDFLKHTISAYGAVAGMNLFFSLLPIVGSIQLGGGYNSFGSRTATIINGVLPINTIVQLLIMIAGLFVVKEFISTISGYIGADNAYQAGAGLRDSVKKGIKDKTVNAAKKTMGAFKMANAMHRAVGNPFSKLGHAISEKHSKKEDKKFFEDYKKENDRYKDKNFKDLTDNEKATMRKRRLLKTKQDKVEKFKEKHEDFEGVTTRDVKNYKKEHRGLIGNFLNGVANVGSAYLENSDVAKAISDEIKFGYGAIIKDNEDYAKRQKDGRYGENKTAEEVNKVAQKGFNAVVAKLDEISQKTAMARLKKGEIEGIDDITLQATGLNVKSTKDEFANADKVARGLYSFQERINNAGSLEARKEIADQALSYIQNQDAGDNAALQKILDEALGQFATIKQDGSINIDANGIEHGFGEAVKNFKEDMEKVSESIAKDFSENIKKYTRKMWEEEAKKGGKS